MSRFKLSATFCFMRSDALQETTQQNVLQVSVHCMQLDVRDIDAVTAIHDELPESFKPVHFLVNNAGLALGTAPGHEADMSVCTPAVCVCTNS
jgi:NADP-dependent 3-hydroxy acid dehydrogenase YdfG